MVPKIGHISNIDRIRTIKSNDEKFYRRFRGDDYMGYLPANEWMEAHKKIMILSTDFEKLINFAEKMIGSSIAFVAERIREEYRNQFPDKGKRRKNDPDMEW